jgi:hypothetical protein
MAEPIQAMLPLADEPPSATPDFTQRQGYLNAAPGGIEARFAWTLPGGSGEGVDIIHLEGTWDLAHEDLQHNQGGVIGSGSMDPQSMSHATAVLGMLVGDRNDLGVTGICPEARVRGISLKSIALAAAILQAAELLRAGDILLITLHRSGPGGAPQHTIPIEWWPDDLAAIRYAVSKGVIVVEAAGLGGQDLDDALYDQRPSGFPSTWRNPLNPANPSSGAILVGSGAPPPGTHGRDHGPDRARLAFSNYGSRLDVQGWGREVTTTGYGDLQGGASRNRWYTDLFAGTASATVMVAGTLACIQGILRAQGGPLLTPAGARNLLRMTGSPQQDAPGRPHTQRIGNRPNLRQMVATVTRVWHRNKTVRMAYATTSTQSAWIYISDLGWRRVKPGTPDGVSNLFSACCQAVGSSVKAHVYADQTFIYRIILL